MELDINKIKEEVLDNINSTELADDIMHALRYNSLQIPGFVYRKDDPGYGGLFVNVKHMGVPNNIEFNELGQEETEELNWAQGARLDAFIEQLQSKYGKVLVSGRSGGYWGLPLDRMSDLIKVNITDEKLNTAIEKSITFSKDWAEQNGYELDDNEYDMAEYTVDNIKSALDEYVTLEPTEKLLNFKTDIEEEAKRWEAMDYSQYVSLM